MTGVTGSPPIRPPLPYEDAKAAIELLTEGLGFTATGVYEGEDGRVAHAEPSFGNGVVMLGGKGTGSAFDRAMAGAGPAGVFVRVDDVDEHHARAVAHGVEVPAPPADQEHGARDHLARDAESDVWSFGTHAPGPAE
ncbi:VOC family protein [Streptomyces sp. NPDC057235]|uniref:VOC family protein n=1 Tax=Streptomyces sp. NPDC057235 TaxID=3346058 RepID=UPI00362E684A